MDVETLSKTLKDKNILPSNLKFGFLGLGIMGSGIVKNLINSGHKVIVWNRTQEKVRDTFFREKKTKLVISSTLLFNNVTRFAHSYNFHDLSIFFPCTMVLEKNGLEKDSP